MFHFVSRAGLALSVVALAACETAIPDSGKGVGFGSYSEYQQQREAELINGATGAVPSDINLQNVSSEAAEVIEAPADPTSQLANDALEAVNASASSVSNEVGISAENDFSAVSNERSIEQDAALVASNREQYQVIEPTDIPDRPAGSTANLVEYALTTTNTVGQPIYSRFIPGAEARALRNCAKFTSAGKAQEAFLEGGGPDRNVKGLDPDGDGFACAWDPAPFRLATASN